MAGISADAARGGAALIDGAIDKGGLRLSNTGLIEDAPAVFATPDAVKAFRKRRGIEAADLLGSLPQHIRDRLHVIEIQQASPFQVIAMAGLSSLLSCSCKLSSGFKYDV